MDKTCLYVKLKGDFQLFKLTRQQTEQNRLHRWLESLLFDPSVNKAVSSIIVVLETTDFVAERTSHPRGKKRQNIQSCFFLYFNSVHIQQSLEITDAKISLLESAIKSYFLPGQQLKIQLVKQQQIRSILWHRIHVILRKFSQDNLQMFLFQPTPFSMLSVQNIFFFF